MLKHIKMDGHLGLFYQPEVLLLKILSRWVECQLKVIATKHKDHMKETKSFLLHLEELNREKGPFPPHARMISWDIVNFYQNCDTGLCLQAVRRAVDRWEPKMREERKRCVCEAVRITIKFNNGEFEKKVFSNNWARL